MVELVTVGIFMECVLMDCYFYILFFCLDLNAKAKQTEKTREYIDHDK